MSWAPKSIGTAAPARRTCTPMSVPATFRCACAEVAGPLLCAAHSRLRCDRATGPPTCLRRCGVLTPASERLGDASRLQASRVVASLRFVSLQGSQTFDVGLVLRASSLFAPD